MPRVLIADDNSHLRQALKALLLRRDGWSVCGEAADGEEVVRMAAELNPDVILLDFQMPVLNGLIAAGRILRANPDMPIVFYTLHQNHFIEQQALAMGVRKVISKGDVITSLMTSIEEVVKSEAKPTGPLRIREDALGSPEVSETRSESQPDKSNGVQKN